MHPELQRRLGVDRHAALLREQEFRHRHVNAVSNPDGQGRRPRRRLSRSLGSALVAAGVRLMDGKLRDLDLVEP